MKLDISALLNAGPSLLTEEETLKFLHISDLHFDSARDGCSSRRLRSELVSCIRDEGLRPDEIFFTGDLRYAPSETVISQAETAEMAANYILEIAKAAGITDTSHIHLVPGNHDRIRSDKGKERYKNIQSEYDCDEGVFSSGDLEFLLSDFSFSFDVCDMELR